MNTKEDLKRNANKRLEELRKAPIHGNLEEILDLAKPDTRTGKIRGLKEYENKKVGTLFVMISGKTYLSSRLVWMQWTKKWIPEDKWVAHLNGNKHDNRLTNLFLASPKKVIKHTLDTGLKPVLPEEEYKRRKLEYTRKWQREHKKETNERVKQLYWADVEQSRKKNREYYRKNITNRRKSMNESYRRTRNKKRMEELEQLKKQIESIGTKNNREKLAELKARVRHLKELLKNINHTQD